jgi:hypothetical protein
MKFYYAQIARTLVVLSAFIAVTNANVGHADDTWRIEEDWELVLGTPDRDTVSPQATCTFAPTGNLDSFYAVFDLNLRNFPSYEAGGVQLQLWNGDSSVEAIREKAGYTLRTDGETITWTQRMTVNDHKLQFAIVNGNSTTWGQFGTSSAIAITIPSELQNLNSYSSELSVENSGIGFGANRVSSLRLVRTRAYSDEEVYQDTTPRVVYPKP